jgi:hypothetical protein
MAPLHRVLAVSFVDQASARVAADLITERVPGVDTVFVAPLGHAHYPSPTGGLLSARFAVDVIDTVRAVVEAAGGTVEMDVAEERLR